jgi:hypothetical protein
MSERERSSRPPVSPRARAAPGRAPVEIAIDDTLDLQGDWDVPWPPAPSRSPTRARVSPTRSGTLRWGDFARIVAERPPSESPVRGGTLKWGELSAAAARAERMASARKSPVRGGTLKWGDLMAQLPPVLEPSLVAAPAPPRRDAFDDLSLDETLAPLLSAGLVRRGGRNLARRRGVDDRRDPTEPPPRIEVSIVPRDLASAIQEALEDDDDG